MPGIRKHAVARRPLAPGAAVVLLLAALSASVHASSAQRQAPDVPAPPPPVEDFVTLTEPEVLAKLPERERAMVERSPAARDKFEALLEVSDLQLADIGSKLDAHVPSVSDSLLLYRAVVIAADRRLRSPEAKVEPRDKRYKNFERRLNKQLALLRAFFTELPANDVDTGTAVTETVKRLRVAALHSALDSNVLDGPPQDQEQ